MIHYHGTPCGATREDVAKFLRGRHALVSFYRPEDLGTAAEVCQSFCLDNGAFSAWKAGKPVQCWDAYMDWAHEWLKHPACDWAIIPDVIDGSEADNDDLISAWCQRWPDVARLGVPVWHLHESLERLESLAYHWDRVALGSSGQWATPGTTGWWRRMGDAMAAVCNDEGQPAAKLHGLRMLDPEVFGRLPLTSADSTNAVRNSSGYKRFGMYCPPNASTRMAIIAERIESQQSAPVWVRPLQGELQLTYEEYVNHGDWPKVETPHPVRK